MPAFNDAMKKLLIAWGKYLSENPESSGTLTTNDDGWFGKFGMAKLRSDGRILEGQTFDYVYKCDSSKVEEKFGYKTWDAFFVREFNPKNIKETRPIRKTGDIAKDACLIYSPCECTPFRISTKVKLHDQFWLKGQPYSLYDMLNNPDQLNSAVPSGDVKARQHAEEFVGGTIFQAFLSPQDFHRWHAPVDGQIVDAFVVPGTYYAVIPDSGAEIGDPDLQPGDPRGGLIRSQSFLSMAATRAIIYIKPTNTLFGDLICFIGIGMCEVSTCELSSKALGKEVVKVGDELGMFHFGGSTQVTMFQNKVEGREIGTVKFGDDIEIDKHVKLHSIIGQVYEKPTNHNGEPVL